MPTLDWLNRDAAFKKLDEVPYRLLELVSEHTTTTRSQHLGDSPDSIGATLDKATKSKDSKNTPQAQLNWANSDKAESNDSPKPTDGNLLIQGDNLEALKALLPFYRGQVKCIFIDPPYNTKSAFEHYDDNLEHAQWLSMMLPRLQLLRELLREDGFVCVHLDDSEGHYLKVLMDEVFRRENYLVSIYPIVRYEDKTLKQDMDFHKRVEQLHVYRKSRLAKPIRPRESVSYEKYNFKITELSIPTEIQLGGKTVQVFSKGGWRVEKVEASVDGLKEIWATGTILDGNSSGRFFRDYLAGRVEADGLGALYKVSGIGDDELPHRFFTGPQKVSATKGKYFQGVPLSKRVATTDESYPIDNSYDFSADFGNCRTEGDADFRSGKKPEVYVQTLLSFFSETEDIVLDSFLGSGTTAAVAQKMNRRWIGIEMREQAVTHCLPRLQKVIDGEQGGISQAVNWHGGGSFRFMKLGATIFNETGAINPEVRFATLAAFIWMQETGAPWVGFPPLQGEDGVRLRTNPSKPIPLPASPLKGEGLKSAGATPFLGTYNGVDYFLLFNGILGDKRPNAGNVLTRVVLQELTLLFPSDGRPRVIYGESNRLGEERLKEALVQFQTLPHEVVKR